MSFTPVFVVLTALCVIVNAQPCRLRDICYTLDKSWSISATQYEQIKSFTVSSSRSFAHPNVTTEYSATWFNSSAGLIQSPTSDLEGVFVPTIEADVPYGGTTNIYRGLSECYNLLRGGSGGGGGTARAIIVVTDGVGHSGTNPLPDIRKDGIAVVSVGVESDVSSKFLQSIATRPEFYVPTTFDKLPQLASAVEKAACAAVTVIECGTAFLNCDFTFGGANRVQAFNISGKPDVPFTPRITHKSDVVGVVNSQAGVFEPVFVDTGRISLEGVQRFTPTAFKSISRQDGGSSIGHETFHGNQLTVASNRCVVVYFQSWQTLNATGGVVIGNTNLQTRNNTACVAFNTFV